MKLEEALRYLRYGWSIIPVGPDKKPIIKEWEPYQHRQPTVEEMQGWFKTRNPAGIALVTGKQSGVYCIDLDRYKPEFDEEVALELIPDGIETPTTRTARGGTHLLFAMPDTELRSRNDFAPCIDLKAEGGYVVLPPSRNHDGVYEWIISPDEAAPAACPDSILKKYKSLYIGHEVNGLPKTSLTSSDFRFFTQGRRDEDLFHAANLMVKGGGEIPFVEKTIELLALQCNPPFALSETQAKIKSALQRAERRDRNIAAEVREWVLTSDGFFLTSDCFRELGLTSRDFQKAATLAMLKLANAGVIERHGNRRGCYRLVDTSEDVIDLKAASIEEFPITMPLSLSDLAILDPGTITIFAGAKDAGKSALAIETAKLNLGRFPIVYMTSEMYGTELRKRLELHKDLSIDDWAKSVKFIKRTGNWADKITGERMLYIIDYIEPAEDRLYEVGTILRSIHEKLKDGVAIICIQKKYGDDLGRGGQFTLDKARLYISLDGGRPNRAKIISCKSFRDRNPRGMVLHFKYRNGSEFVPEGYWKYEG